MRGAITLLPPYAFMTCEGKSLHVFFLLYTLKTAVLEEYPKSMSFYSVTSEKWE